MTPISCSTQKDATDSRKQERARELLRLAFRKKVAWLSVQVLNEFFSVAKKKLSISAEVAREHIEAYSHLNVIQIEPDDVLAAINLYRLHGWSIWDALILQAAIKAGCSRLYTEEMQHGRRISGVEICNPFLEEVNEDAVESYRS